MLVGGGAYGAMRLANDIPKAITPQDKNRHQLDVTLPAARVPKTAGAWDEYVAPALSMGGGAAAGFYGASSIYEHLKKKQMENQMKNVEQQYLSTLQKAHQKTASLNTPHVDKFIQGMISKIGYAAQDAFSHLANSESKVPWSELGRTELHDAGSGLLHSALGKLLLGAGALTGLGTAGSVFYIHNQADKQKEQNHRNSTLPTDVNLNVA